VARRGKSGTTSNIGCVFVCDVNRYVGRQLHNHVYGVGKGLIGLDDVHCSGNEKRIFECSHGLWGVHNCGHSEDVAVSCFNSSAGIASVTVVKLAKTLKLQSPIGYS